MVTIYDQVNFHKWKWQLSTPYLYCWEATTQLVNSDMLAWKINEESMMMMMSKGEKVYSITFIIMKN